jgi:predicted transcriptional regulator
MEQQMDKPTQMNMETLRRRSYWDIIECILKVWQRPSLQTTIVYTSNINTHLFYRYIPLLERDGLVERVELWKEGFWRTTEKGFKVLGLSREISLLAPSLFLL